MNFNELRARISICEIAELLGFQLDNKAGKSHLSYYLGDINNKTEEIIIYNPNNKSTQTYFNRKGTDKGNLINFVLHRLDQFPFCDKSGMAGVNQVLHHYLGTENKIEIYAKKSSPIITSPDVFDKEYWKPHTISPNNKYLTLHRSISPSTIKTFGEKGFICAVGKCRHIGFPFSHPGETEVTNYEMRNYFEKDKKNYKGFCKGGDKSSSLWIANFLSHKEIKDVYLFESAIDALSFFELNNLSSTMPIALISTGGNVTKKQIEKLPEIFPQAQFHSCYDNDIMGKLFDVSTAFYLKNQECKVFKNNGEVHINTGLMSYTFPEEKFDSRVFLSLQNSNLKIKKVDSKYKDWNEKLCEVKLKEKDTEVIAEI